MARWHAKSALRDNRPIRAQYDDWGRFLASGFRADCRECPGKRGTITSRQRPGTITADCVAALAVSSQPVSGPNSLLTGKTQGISRVLAVQIAPYSPATRIQSHSPGIHPSPSTIFNRELIRAYQGIYWEGQGISSSRFSSFAGIALPKDPAQ